MPAKDFPAPYLTAIVDLDALRHNLALVRRSVPAGTEIIDHRPHLIMPGFIDAHLHMPQTQVIASYGAQLMDWLNRYTFVEEQKCGQQGHPEKLADFLLG